MNKSPGRPPIYNKPMKQTAILLPAHQLEYINQLVQVGHTASLSAYVRDLIESDMRNPLKNWMIK